MSVLAALTRLDAATDGQLLGRFVQSRDADAFAALVRRLGPTVLAVCRRACPDSHLAEDAFQAAFLVLARKADAVRPREQVAVWLHGVAYRTASKACAMLAARRRRELATPTLPDPPAPDAVTPDDDELRKLDAAIAALPDHLRAAVVLCELEGRSRKDAARQLGIAEGTLSSRLADARKRLGARIRPTVAVVTAALAASTAEAAVSGSTSETVLSLARGVMSMMLLNKLKLSAVVLAVVTLTVLGLSALSPTALTAAPVPKEKERTNPFVEWKYTEPCGELTSPILCGDKVVVGTGNGLLRAFRSRDGEAVWEYKHGKRIYHTPSTDGERVYFTSSKGVTAVSADKGEEVWRFDVKQGDGPVWADAKLGLVFTAGENGQAYALDAKSGEDKWSVDFVTDAPPDRPGFLGKNARIDGTLARPRALAFDGKLLVLSVFDQSRVVAFDPKTGKRQWAFQAGGWIYGGAVFTPTRVFVGSQDDHLHALDRDTGKPVWQFATQKRIECAPTADDANVYVAACDGTVYAVGQKDGKKAWAYECDRDAGDKPPAIYSTPLLTRDILHFATTEGQFYAVNTRGELRWKLRPVENSRVYSDPVTDGTRFFLTTAPGRVVVGKPAPNPLGEAALVAIGLK